MKHWPDIKTPALFLLVLFSTGLFAYGQQTDSVGIDNNPKLTTAESAWLNQHIESGGFDFSNKYVGFIDLLSGAFYGIGKLKFPLKKKDFFRSGLTGRQYKFYVLDSAERRQSNGLDAVLVVVADKNKGKLKRLKREDALEWASNRYPQIPADAGLDNDPELSTANAAFLNEVYKYAGHMKEPFDFNGKKIAIFDTHCDREKIEQKKISDYLARINAQLDEYGHCFTEYTHVLTPEQKKESGGYDLIIQYRCKMDTPVSVLIAQLKKTAYINPSLPGEKPPASRIDP